MKTIGRYKLTPEQVAELTQFYQSRQYQSISKKIHAVLLRGEGKTVREVCELTKLSHGTVTHYTKLYLTEGIAGLTKETRGGRRRSLVSKEEEIGFLEEIASEAQEGQYVTVDAILEAFNKKFGVTMAKNSMYYLLKRHGWKKVKGRPVHPKKATPSEIETAKKLTPKSNN